MRTQFVWRVFVWKAMALLLALSLVATACGDDDDDDATGTGTAQDDGAGDDGSASAPGDGDGSDASDDTDADSGGDATAPSDDGGDSGDGDDVMAECPGTGTLDVATFSEPRGLDPVMAGGGSTGSIEVAAIYDVLVRRVPETGEYEPWLAESLEPNGDFSEWVLTLRPGLTFGNGDPLTAEDVKTNVERHQSEELGSLQRSLALQITDMEVGSDTELTFTLESGWSNFPYLLGGPVGMIANPRVIEELGDEFAKMPTGAGAGPFEVERNAPGEEIVMAAKQDYWGGPVCSESVRFVRFAGSEVTYDALRNGDVDVAFLRQPEVIAEARDDGVSMHSLLSNVGELILVNNGYRDSATPTSDVRLRQAIVSAVDPALVNERANGGVGLATNAVFHEDSRLYPGVEGPTVDADRAAELVAEVLAEGEWDGTIRFKCDAAREETALAVEAQLEAAGFDVDLEIVAAISDLVSSVIVDANYDLACWGFNVTDEGPWAKLNRQITSTGGSNFSGYANDEMDAAVAALQSAPDEAAALDAVSEVQRVWTETAPSAVLAAVEEVIAYDDSVTGAVFTEESVVLLGGAHSS